MNGIVKTYNPRRGYGFLHPLIGLGPEAPPVFFHASALKEGAQSVPIGAEVKFDLVRGVKGPQACNVEPVKVNGNTLGPRPKHAPPRIIYDTKVIVPEAPGIRAKGAA